MIHDYYQANGEATGSLHVRVAENAFIKVILVDSYTRHRKDGRATFCMEPSNVSPSRPFTLDH